MTPEEIIKRPIILSEKAANLREDQNQYMFEVARQANKVQIREAVETLFNVNVVKVNTLIVRGRMRRMGRGHAKTKNWKKAYVTLTEGETIDLFEGA